MPENRLPVLSMRSRLILAFAIFAIVVIALLWVFQTVWIDSLYESVKYLELKKCASLVEESLYENTLQEMAAELSGKYNLCLSVYQIRQGYGSMITDEHVNMFCMIHSITSSAHLNQIYRTIRESGQPYTEEGSIADIFQNVNPALADPSRLTEENRDAPDRTRSVMYADIFSPSSTGTTEYLVLLNTEIVPLTATMTALQMQTVFLSVLLTILVVVTGLIVSAHLSRPLTAMCREAERLSMGNYHVNFDGGNCRETMRLSEALNRAAYELSQLDKMQKDLIANISHDLRTPLTMISGYSEVIRDLPGEATPENMQVIIDETNRLTSLVNDMLEVSRYQNQSDAQILHITRFNLTATLRSTLDRYARLREKDGYIFRLEAERDIWVEADEHRILQVLYNLINNAVNYTGDDKTVTVRQDCTEEEVILSVIDTGMGIPSEQLPLVWERYYKAHDFHKRANMGTGLGLSIVKNVLVLHQARFGVQSTVGQGSIFWFALRIAEPEAPETETAEKADNG